MTKDHAREIRAMIDDRADELTKLGRGINNRLIELLRLSLEEPGKYGEDEGREYQDLYGRFNTIIQHSNGIKAELTALDDGPTPPSADSYQEILDKLDAVRGLLSDELIEKLKQLDNLEEIVERSVQVKIDQIGSPSTQPPPPAPAPAPATARDSTAAAPPTDPDQPTSWWSKVRAGCSKAFEQLPEGQRRTKSERKPPKNN